MKLHDTSSISEAVALLVYHRAKATQLVIV